jgi:hypothetical protein
MDQIPAGWYPYGPAGERRYWDGTAWTEAFVPPSPTLQPQPHRRQRAVSIASIACIVLGSALLIGALFAPWFQDTSSLASQSSQLSFNLPSIVLAVAAVGLRECANRSWPAAGSGVPAVEDPGPA